MHVMTIDDQRAHEFEREQGEVYGRLWRKERLERNDAIIL